MTVKELIKLLKKCDQGKEVVVGAGEQAEGWAKHVEEFGGFVAIDGEFEWEK